MMKRFATAAMLVALAAFSAPAMAEGSGKCGKGKKWDAESQSCVKKPRSGGTGSGSLVP
jgi:hypothetical protein